MSIIVNNIPKNNIMLYINLNEFTIIYSNYKNADILPLKAI